jgi:hypothetical protein
MQFIVLLAASHIRHLTLSEPNDDRLHDHFRLPSGEILALMSRCIPLSERAIALIRTAVGSWTVHGPDGGPPDPDGRLRCSMVVVDGADGVKRC